MKGCLSLLRKSTKLRKIFKKGVHNEQNQIKKNYI